MCFGALIELVYIISGFASLAGIVFVHIIMLAIAPLEAILNLIVGLVIVILTFLVAIKPNKPLPYHWLVLFILGILLVIFGAGIWACVLVVIAALMGLIEEL